MYFLQFLMPKADFLSSSLSMYYIKIWPPIFSIEIFITRFQILTNTSNIYCKISDTMFLILRIQYTRYYQLVDFGNINHQLILVHNSDILNLDPCRRASLSIRNYRQQCHFPAFFISSILTFAPSLASRTSVKTILKACAFWEYYCSQSHSVDCSIICGVVIEIKMYRKLVMEV